MVCSKPHNKRFWWEAEMGDPDSTIITMIIIIFDKSLPLWWHDLWSELSYDIVIKCMERHFNGLEKMFLGYFWVSVSVSVSFSFSCRLSIEDLITKLVSSGLVSCCERHCLCLKFENLRTLQKRGVRSFVHTRDRRLSIVLDEKVKLRTINNPNKSN